MENKKRYEGIDVSHWDDGIDFESVKDAGVSVVYMKASEGAAYIDPNFEKNYRGALKAGLKIGFYHFVTARSIEEARQEAQHFAQVIDGKEYQGCPVMDFESFGDLTKEQVNEISLVFLQELQTATGGIVAIYSDSSNAANLFDKRLSEYPLWIAEYNVISPSMKNPWKNWAGWQYTDSGQVSGISGPVDRNYFKKDMLKRQLKDFCL